MYAVADAVVDAETSPLCCRVVVRELNLSGLIIRTLIYLCA